MAWQHPRQYAQPGSNGGFSIGAVLRRKAWQRLWLYDLT